MTAVQARQSIGTTGFKVVTQFLRLRIERADIALIERDDDAGHRVDRRHEGRLPASRRDANRSSLRETRGCRAAAREDAPDYWYGRGCD